MSLFALWLAASPMHLPPMPEPVSNNAVAKVVSEGVPYLLSFSGLGPDKDYRAVHNRAWALPLTDDGQWRALESVPGQGRLASVAVGLGADAYLFGGYTVEADHSEVSLPDVHRFTLGQGYQPLAPMPVPVDDAVALVYQQRYIYLVSGWHNDGNVNLVQLYDTQTDRWTQASPFPGAPVFGHSGALLGNTLLVCDGVKVVYHDNRRRGFAPEAACYLGSIDKDNPTRIDWRLAPHHSGTARYRMAAAAVVERNELWFVGGTHSPYNYDGTGYDGVAAHPSERISVFNLTDGRWRNLASDEASMDHRGAVQQGERLLVPGGMGPGQKVLKKVRQIPLSGRD